MNQNLPKNEILERVKASKADGVDCFFDPDYVTDDFVKMFADAGLEFHVWTVDDLDLALEAFRRGAKTVTTNCAKKLLDEHDARQSKARAPTHYNFQGRRTK
jgi:glycerophosphoryl diester phosphodiesterase